MSDGLTLFPVNRNNSDLCLVIKFTHSYTTCIGRAQRDVIYRAVMYACPAKLPGPKETSGTEKDTSVFSLFWHYIPLCILPVSYITWASDELHVGFDRSQSCWVIKPLLEPMWSGSRTYALTTTYESESQGRLHTYYKELVVETMRDDRIPRECGG